MSISLTDDFGCFKQNAMSQTAVNRLPQKEKPLYAEVEVTSSPQTSRRVLHADREVLNLGFYRKEQKENGEGKGSEKEEQGDTQTLLQVKDRLLASQPLGKGRERRCLSTHCTLWSELVPSILWVLPLPSTCCVTLGKKVTSLFPHCL